jgi:hypothetical protein
MKRFGFCSGPKYELGFFERRSVWAKPGAKVDPLRCFRVRFSRQVHCNPPRCRQRVLQGKVATVVRGLKRLASEHKLNAVKKRSLWCICSYLYKNRHRMRYDEYLAKGYPIASGVIEGACRHLVKDRMERAGMHWTLPSTQAMLDVRTVHVSGQWKAFQHDRIERLYPPLVSASLGRLSSSCQPSGSTVTPSQSSAARQH